jgi:transcriptional regulator with XRE-family HTH domain
MLNYSLERFMTIGDRISLFAKKCYGSQKNFAEFLHMSPQQITAYVTGTRTAHIYILRQFYNSGMSVDWLLTGQGSMFADNPRGQKLMEELQKKYKYEFEHDPTLQPPTKRLNQDDIKQIVQLATVETLRELAEAGRIELKEGESMDDLIVKEGEFE